MLDRLFALTLRDLTTYVLIAAVAVLPIQAGAAFLFRDAIEVRDIHDEIAGFPTGLQVKGVSASDLDAYRLTGWILIAVNIALLVPITAAIRQALARREENELASVKDAWARAPDNIAGVLTGLRKEPGTIAMAALVALVIGVLAQAIASLMSEPVPDRYAWAAVALLTTTARSLGLVFVAVPLAALAGPPAKAGP